jgi:hypothetical protein
MDYALIVVSIVGLAALVLVTLYALFAPAHRNR